MHETAGLVIQALGQMRGQPLDQPLHRFERVRLAGAVLAGPALDLARQIALGLAEIGQTHRLDVHLMDPSQRVGHGRIDGAALGG